MSDFNESRSEKRLGYDWPMQFCQENDKKFIGGQMVDVSSTHAAFTCDPQFNLNARAILVVKISVPEYTSKDKFRAKDFTRFGTLFRVDLINPTLKLIVVKFTTPLSFKPGEQKFLNPAVLKSSQAPN